MKNNRRKKYKINYLKMICTTVVLIVCICLIIKGIKTVGNKMNNKSTNIETSTKIEIVPKDISINFVAIGDVMCHNTNYLAAYNSSTKAYDFTPAFVNVEKHIKKADIAIGNLETTFTGSEVGYSGYPTFNSPEQLGIALKNIGIDVLSTANNHCMDKGSKGIINTLDNLDKIEINHAGTNRSKEEQDTILVKDVNGVKIAFIAFTYGTNGIKIPEGKEYLVNLIDKDFMKEQIDLAKKQSPDIICASMHWGIEYAQKQNKEQEELAEFLFKSGVDIIIGNHAHVIEPMEKRTITLDDGTQKDAFVVYALGNFISGQVKEHTKSTAILDMNITKKGENGKISIDSVDYIPVYCYDRGKGVQNRYILLDMREEIQDYEEGKGNISQSLYNTLKKELENTEKVLGEPINNNIDKNE